MNVVDSSGWLEYFADGPNADRFAPAILATDVLVTPTLCLFEVYKRVLQQRGSDDALQAVAAMERGRVVDLSRSIALDAAQLSLQERLHAADSIVLATARACRAVVWTQDSDLERFTDVRYFMRSP